MTADTGSAREASSWFTPAEIELLDEAARRRGIDRATLVRDGLSRYLAPPSTHEAELPQLRPHVDPVEPLARLQPLQRLAVLAIGEAVASVWRWSGHGRYRIGQRLVTNGKLRLAGPGTIWLGHDINAWARSGSNLLIAHTRNARILVGDRVRLNGAGLQATSEITIGDDCILGSCTIVDSDHHDPDPVNRRGAPPPRPIRIGRNVWIGGAAVLKGVSIGDNSVVGLSSTVTSDVPPNVVVAGNPARVVRRLDDHLSRTEVDGARG